MSTLFRETLPPESIVSDAATIDQYYRRNVTALARAVPLVLWPGSEDEVGRIVAVANTHRIALYPFSTGMNWGLGSKLPVVDGCVLVDLSRMQRIVEVNERSGYAIIEPGVTQAQLATHLAASHPALTMNFTGSFAHTGIVGNVLERGDGGHARVHDLLGVRGILGNGKPFEAGGVWQYVGTEQPSHCSRYVAGPDLAGLFAQSNFGIVTQMAFRLVHKPERRYLFWGSAPDAALEALVDRFDYFGRQRIIDRGSVNIGDENRFVQAKRALGDATGPPAGEQSVWNFFALVDGTARVADAAITELTDAFTPLCTSIGALRADQVAEEGRTLPAFLQPLVKPLTGSPDSDSLGLIYRLTGTPLPNDPREMNADHTPFGMKCYIGIVPPAGESVRRAARIASAAEQACETNVKFSVFGDGRTLITMHFRADDPAQVARAERCEQRLWQEMVAAGFPPYRVSIDQMERLVALRPEFFALVKQLKSVLDPNGIISPGRYCPV